MTALGTLTVLGSLAMGFAVHEAAHAAAALLLGDLTPAASGRVTWRLWRHLSLVGSVLVPLATLAACGVAAGWARPVDFDARAMRGGRFGVAIVALAGPASNAGLAVPGVIVLRTAPVGPVSEAVWIFVAVQVALFAVNVLPVPPLDGGIALSQALPRRAADAVLDHRWAGLALALPVAVMSPWVPAVLRIAHDLAFGVPRG